MNYYEIVIKYDRNLTDYIVFKDKRMAISSKGIIDIAVEIGLVDPQLYSKIEVAQSLNTAEYKYI